MSHLSPCRILKSLAVSNQVLNKTTSNIMLERISLSIKSRGNCLFVLALQEEQNTPQKIFDNFLWNSLILGQEIEKSEKKSKHLKSYVP